MPVMPLADHAVGVAQFVVHKKEQSKQNRQQCEQNQREARTDHQHVGHNAEQHKEVGDGSGDAVGNERLQPLNVGSDAGEQCADRRTVEPRLLHAQRFTEHIHAQVIHNPLTDPCG